MAKKSATDSELALFLDMLIAERGAAAHTIEAYTRDLAAFLAFLAARGADCQDRDQRTDSRLPCRP